ncbi:MAG: head GIN domain-containing protein [Bacteroidota bacterium]|nr:head GIN domain-containing protein [Bacteroidota bacterium]
MTRGKITFMLCILFTAISTMVYAEREERHVGPFSEISLKIWAEVHVEQGTKQSVEIVGKTEDIGQVITEVNNRQLTIRRSTKEMLLGDSNQKKLTIYITVPEVTALNISGSGQLTVDGPLTARIIDLAVSGSGILKLTNLSSEKISADMSGSGQIIIEGKEQAESLSIKKSGSGTFRSSQLKVKEVKALISGSGNCYVCALNSLKAKIAGSGNVIYKGDPSIDSSIVGSGKVKPE